MAEPTEFNAPPNFKNQPHAALEFLFNSHKEGFEIKDLKTVVKSEIFFNLIKSQTQTEYPWTARFIWQVDTFPGIADDQHGYFQADDHYDISEEVSTIFGGSNMKDTVLAIAKNDQSYAVISLTNKSDIWYRHYENDWSSYRNVDSRFLKEIGTLKYAYIQTYLYEEVEGGPNKTTCESIFLSFHPKSDRRASDELSFDHLTAEIQRYDISHTIKTYTIGATDTTDTLLGTDTIDDDDATAFHIEDVESAQLFAQSHGVSRYRYLIYYIPDGRPGSRWHLNRKLFFKDCESPPIGLINWEDNTTIPESLLSSMIDSIMCKYLKI